METMRLNEMAAKAGADAVLVVTPNYYKGEMTDPVLARFYTDVADASPLPVILYNMPRNAGINISAKLAVSWQSIRTSSESRTAAATSSRSRT